jgi:glycosyltransferase involved in cell wall biosynthesis
MPAEPLEVLHLVESLGPGGAEQNLLSVLRALPPDRFRNHLGWLYDDERLLDGFRPHVASLVPLRARGRLGMVGAIRRLTTWLNRHRTDVIHTQLIRAQLVGRAAALLAGRIPVVTTWQNVFYDDQALPDFRNSRVLRALVRSLDQLSGRADRRFIAVSEHVAAQQCDTLGVDRRRVSVIFNCVEPARYQAVSPQTLSVTRETLGIKPGARVLLAVGRLVEQKGHLDLIRCFPPVLAQVPDAILLIAGHGPLREDLERAVQQGGLAGRVVLLGARRDVPALYQLADLFVFPSRYEGLSVALVEALANGLPAVVSDIPQNREVAEGTPSVRFVPIGDLAGWASSIVAALEAPEPRGTPDGHRVRLQRSFAPELLGTMVGRTLATAARGATDYG